MVLFINRDCVSSAYGFLVKCGGRGSNPRRPSPAGPKPASFGHSDTPAFVQGLTVYLGLKIKVFGGFFMLIDHLGSGLG